MSLSKYHESSESCLKLTTSAEGLGLGSLSLKDKNLVVNLNTGNQIIGSGNGDGDIKQQLVNYPIQRQQQHGGNGHETTSCGLGCKEFHHEEYSSFNEIKHPKQECKCKNSGNSTSGTSTIKLCVPETHSLFVDGCKYKITSVVDGSVLDVGGESKVIIWTWNKSSTQKWSTFRGRSGFYLAPDLSGRCEKIVLDLFVKKQTVGLFGYHGGKNQEWVVSQVCKRTGAVLIINACTGSVLRNMGHGQQVKCEPRQRGCTGTQDQCTWWYINSI